MLDVLKTKRALLCYHTGISNCYDIWIAAKNLVYLGIQIISIYGLFYSIWHVGIENKLLSGPASCSGSLMITNNTTNLKEQILAKPVINCEDVAWSILGLSAETINSLLLILIFILNAIYLWKYNGSQKKKEISN